MNGRQDEVNKVVTAVCEKHGLRYNPATHSGCVRCRKEAGEQIGTVPGHGATTGVQAARSRGSIAAALAMTFALVMVSSFLLFFLHQASWEEEQAARELHQRWMEEGMEGLTPEEQEQLRGQFEELEKIFGRLPSR